MVVIGTEYIDKNEKDKIYSLYKKYNQCKTKASKLDLHIIRPVIKEKILQRVATPIAPFNMETSPFVILFIVPVIFHRRYY